MTLEEVKSTQDACNAITLSTIWGVQPKLKRRCFFIPLTATLGLYCCKISVQDFIRSIRMVLLSWSQCWLTLLLPLKRTPSKSRGNCMIFNPKRSNGKVQTMNQSVRGIMVHLQAADHSINNDNTMIALYWAYSGSSNEEFIMYCKDDCNGLALTSVKELME